MHKKSIFEDKIDKIRRGFPIRVLDLFAGCGGLSLGFHRAGFEISGAIEFDSFAARSHADNFYRSKSQAIRNVHAHSRDITKIEPEQFVCEMGITSPAYNAFDVIVGGPPCQAFARVGRAKLREIADHPEAFKLDSRSNLYLQYLHFVRQLCPVAILMENVPDILNYGGYNIAEEVCETLQELGYVCRYTLLNAVFYGVPQMRERMFLIAFRQELNAIPIFPDPTHHYELPRGYKGSRQVALRTVKFDLLSENTFYISSPQTKNPSQLLKAVSAQEALDDLPKITAHLEGKLSRGTRHFDIMAPYPTGPTLSTYAQDIRLWPEFEQVQGVKDHVIRSLPRDYQIFRRMNAGDQYPAAYRHATEIFQEKLAFERAKGRKILDGSPAYLALKKSIVPPYDPGKFPNKWRKMEPNQPARTLMAHLGKDGYSHIHYDSSQARTISVREAARLQSFPDGFCFAGTMNPAFRQIGNAVPPLMAYRLALSIRQGLGACDEKKTCDQKANEVGPDILQMAI